MPERIHLVFLDYTSEAIFVAAFKSIEAAQNHVAALAAKRLNRWPPYTIETVDLQDSFPVTNQSQIGHV